MSAVANNFYTPVKDAKVCYLPNKYRKLFKVPDKFKQSARNFTFPQQKFWEFLRYNGDLSEGYSVWFAQYPSEKVNRIYFTYCLLGKYYRHRRVTHLERIGVGFHGNFRYSHIGNCLIASNARNVYLVKGTKVIKLLKLSEVKYNWLYIKAINIFTTHEDLKQDTPTISLAILYTNHVLEHWKVDIAYITSEIETEKFTNKIESKEIYNYMEDIEFSPNGLDESDTEEQFKDGYAACKESERSDFGKDQFGVQPGMKLFSRIKIKAEPNGNKDLLVTNIYIEPSEKKIVFKGFYNYGELMRYGEFDATEFFIKQNFD